MQEKKILLWHELLQLSAELQDTGEIQATDATGMDRVAASQHYTKRANYTFKSVKTTGLIDCTTRVIKYIHCSMKQPHETQIAGKTSNET